MKADLDTAIVWAVEAHEGQLDKNGEPYILHPLRVMLAVGPADRIVAVLHDVVEDCEKVGLGDILAWFGEDVRAAVDALTRRPDEMYHDFIKRCAENPTARSVKIADIKDNLRPGNTPDARAKYFAALHFLEKGQS